MSDIVLCTLNARYWHSAFGLRYLLANMGPLAKQTKLLEFGIKDNTIEILGTILQQNPKIVGLGIYIWNLDPITKLVGELKRVAPEVKVVIGGPEVSYENEELEVVRLADCVVAGEADLEFPRVCQQLLSGHKPDRKFVQAPAPAMSEVALPYDLYTDEDLAHRVIYVEASRGCPFTCEFCLSALEIPVRLVDVDLFLDSMHSLLDRGARQFKFVDRTFNLNIRVSKKILQFFLDRYVDGMFLHFELIPDRLPDDLRTLIAQFPAGALQFEIGVQTFNDEVGQRVSRRQDNEQLETNFRFLRSETGVHIHADLIVGLPGETIESFALGFDRLVKLDPQEIQVGMLKRLRGTPITRHDELWKMVYSPHPPYEILTTSVIDFPTMQRLRRFARYWDLVSNSGNFPATKQLLWSRGTSPFRQFLEFSDWLYAKEKKLHGISLAVLSQRLFEFLQADGGDELELAQRIWADYARGGRKDKPHFLRHYRLPDLSAGTGRAAPPRQARHLQQGG